MKVVLPKIISLRTSVVLTTSAKTNVECYSLESTMLIKTTTKYQVLNNNNKEKTIVSTYQSKEIYSLKSKHCNFTFRASQEYITICMRVSMDYGSGQ